MNVPLAPALIDRPCSEVLAAIRRALLRAGLRALETFDLQAARLGAGGCTCPHHGAAACDCQMVVLLIYGQALAPATLILHGSEGRTWLSMPEDAARPLEISTTAAIEQSIRAAQSE